MQKPVFPFTAIVGQERTKRALLVNAIDPRIGGVLIRGEKGTAKSTSVRALAALLPRISVVQGCAFSCDPDNPADLCASCREQRQKGESVMKIQRQARIVELPVGATEDRVLGTLDLEKAIQQGERHFQPGLFAAAHRGILYIDEVNLLNDHLVDILLDAAAMGTNFVEREGISFSHPAQFLLIGTMNPEEGDLRPQLLDRFGLCVEVERIEAAELRMQIVERRIQFESDPEGFSRQWRKAEDTSRERLKRAVLRLPSVVLNPEMLKLIVQICSDFKVDGLRADITMYKCARALAAYGGRTEVHESDIKEAAELVLLHRQRRKPFEQPKLDPEELQRTIDQNRKDRSDATANQATDPRTDENTPGEDRQADGTTPQEQVFEVGAPADAKLLSLPYHDKLERDAGGRRSKTKTTAKTGHYVAARIPVDEVQDFALDATLSAAAPHQKSRRDLDRDNVRTAMIIQKSDLREKVRESKIGNLILFVVDASGSMAAQRRMAAAKGAILSMLLDAYQQRDRIGLITFRGQRATLVIPPTNSVELAEACLKKLPTGGRTPLGHALEVAAMTIEQQRIRDRQIIPLLVLISDGRANVATREEDPIGEATQWAGHLLAHGVRAIVIDTESGFVRLGLARQICEGLGGRYVHIEELESDSVVNAVRQSLN